MENGKNDGYFDPLFSTIEKIKSAAHTFDIIPEDYFEAGQTTIDGGLVFIIAGLIYKIKNIQKQMDLLVKRLEAFECERKSISDVNDK